ncbi:hypothetical protein M8Z33_23245 [Streptomyces sp. ZAF1911]|uniref:hypothetical protein n=1 Tax=Streptomyces sp. ZAF1911 TaxID=2944129 RepID=UPI00237AF36C|nr:hypothetical protein [Streptomyces sp. ZAF1911]MDD9379516.1 hypothetical protein [Streptomyces sp. ZAF1911]
MKKFTRAAATALLLSVAALGLSLPLAGAAVAGECPSCFDGTSVTADLGPAWAGQSVRAGGCTGCWPSGVIAPTGRTGDKGDA